MAAVTQTLRQTRRNLNRLLGGAKGAGILVGDIQADSGDVVLKRSPKLTLSSTQLLALHATPIDLLAAPGAGLFVDFESIVITKPAGTAYAAVAAGDDLNIRETDGSGTLLAAVETIGFLDQTTVQTRIVRPFRIVAATLVSDITRLANTSIALSLGGAVTTGDSPLYFQVYYWVRPAVVS